MRSLFALAVVCTSSFAAFAAEPAHTPTGPLPGALPIVAPKEQLAAHVSADADAVNAKGEHAVQLAVSSIAVAPAAAKALKGKHVAWTLYVKRKLAGWDSARNYPIADVDSLVKNDAIADVSSSLLFVTLARDGFLPGEHEAAIVGTVDGGKVEVFRGETSFVLKPGAFVPVHRSRR